MVQWLGVTVKAWEVNDSTGTMPGHRDLRGQWNSTGAQSNEDIMTTYILTDLGRLMTCLALHPTWAYWREEQSRLLRGAVKAEPKISFARPDAE